MARNLDPKCKQCRREGVKLFIKGERCFSQKCSVVKRKYPPGIHGPKRQSRLTPYGIQLREKQKAKRIYGILEKQFSNYFKKAVRMKGDSGYNLLRFLELNLGNAVYRAGFTAARDTARQLVNHGHILVNGKKVDINSYQLKIGDAVRVKDSSSFVKIIKERTASQSGKAGLPSWISVDADKAEFKVVSQPVPEDLPQNVNVKLIVEYYSKQ